MAHLVLSLIQSRYSVGNWCTFYGPRPWWNLKCNPLLPVYAFEGGLLQKVGGDITHGADCIFRTTKV